MNRGMKPIGEHYILSRCVVLLGVSASIPLLNSIRQIQLMRPAMVRYINENIMLSG